MPALIGGFGNWFVPILIGAPDMAKLTKLMQRVYSDAGWFIFTGFIWGWRAGRKATGTKKKHNEIFCITFHQKNYSVYFHIVLEEVKRVEYEDRIEVSRPLVKKQSVSGQWLITISFNEFQTFRLGCHHVNQ